MFPDKRPALYAAVRWLTASRIDLPVTLLSSDACELAPLRNVLLCVFFYLFSFFFLLLFLIRVSSAMIMYNRRTLLDIGQRYTNLIQDTLSTDPAWPLEILRINKLNNDHLNNRRRRKKHRGRRAGIRNRLRKRAHSPPLPSILLANVQSLENKMDDLRARISFQRDIRDCNILCLTETWLTPTVPDTAVTPSDNFSVLRMDRTAEAGKTKGGGVCFFINKKWCDPRNISILSRSCSPHLEHLSIICRPFYLPWEFSSIVITSVYIPPQLDTSLALSTLHDELSGYINKHPDAACIIAGDYNKANLKKVIPNFHQHISCPTRGLNTLDHCYTPLKNAYKAHSLPAFGKSDHAAIFLTPEYKQRIVHEPPVEREVTRWSSHSEAMLQASLDDVDWDMFRASSSDVSEFTDVALSFVNTLTEQATETVKIRTFTNQKPWVDRSMYVLILKPAYMLYMVWAWDRSKWTNAKTKIASGNKVLGTEGVFKQDMEKNCQRVEKKEKSENILTQSFSHVIRDVTVWTFLITIIVTKIIMVISRDATVIDFVDTIIVWGIIMVLRFWRLLCIYLFPNITNA